jgi:bifunctional non-homologous end joining protein LigD
MPVAREHQSAFDGCGIKSLGSTLASVYSARPTPLATVSAPVTWDEIESGVEIEDFHLRNMAQRIKDVGDLWAPLAAARGRFNLQKLLGGIHA